MNLSKITGTTILNDSKEPFLAIKIETDTVKSAYWIPEEKEAKILAFGTTEEWGKTKEELLVACDASISAATARLPEFIQEAPRNLILGIPSFWVLDEKITQEKLNDLRFVAEKLTLHPLGFVVIPEAILHYLKQKDESVGSGILIYVGTTEISVTLFKEGKIIQSELVGRSDNLALDVEEGILRFKQEVSLPERIFLYDTQDLIEVKQTLVSYPWQAPEIGRPGFFHLPRIETLPKEWDIEAVVFAGYQDIKKEGSKKEDVEPKKTSCQATETADMRPPQIIFFKDKDILLELKKEGDQIPDKKEIIEEKGKEEIFEVMSEPEKGLKKEQFFLKNQFLGIWERIKKIPGIIFQLFGTGFNFSKKFFLTGKLTILGFSTFIIFFFLSFYFLNKAYISLVFQTEELQKDFEFFINPKIKKIDFEQKIIPAYEIFEEISGEKVLPVTGRKTVGERARGEIIIYNRTDLPKTFQAQEVLIGPGKLKFLLDEQVFVASKTPDLTSGVDRWGEAKAKVSAFDIGAQYNIAAGSQFYFENYPTSSFLVKNENAFSGGTSRQISVVSIEDQKKILEDLEKELNEKARSNIEKKLNSGEIIVWKTAYNEVVEKLFDHELQEEASSLSLKLKIRQGVLIFKKNDFLDLISQIIQSEIKGGRKIDHEKTKVTIASVGEKDDQDNYSVTAKTSIFLKREIKEKEIAEKIKGKPISKAQNILSQIDGVKGIQIKISPGIFKIFTIIPYKKENIFFEILAE